LVRRVLVRSQARSIDVTHACAAKTARYVDASTSTANASPRIFGATPNLDEDHPMSEEITSITLPLPAPSDDRCRKCGESAPEMIFTGGRRGTVLCPRCFGDPQPTIPTEGQDRG